MGYQPGYFPEGAIFTSGKDKTYQRAAELPTGTWNVMANGRIFQLEIVSVERGGRVKATLNSGTFQDGHWNPDDGLLKFTRVLPDGNPQHWAGYLMYQAALDPSFRMAGTIDQPNIRNSGGWYATAPRA